MKCIAAVITAVLASLSLHAEAGGSKYPPMPPAPPAPAVTPTPAPTIAPTIAPNIQTVVTPGAPSHVESYSGSQYSPTNKALAVGLGAAANSATCGQPILGGLLVYESAVCAWRTTCSTLAELGLPGAAKQCACAHEIGREAVIASGGTCNVEVRYWHGPIGPQYASP